MRNPVPCLRSVVLIAIASIAVNSFATAGFETAALAAQEPSPDERHLFRFDPPSDPFIFERSVKIRRESTVEGQPPRIDEMTGEEKVRIHSIPSGYHYEVAVQSVEMRRNGELINDPILLTLSAIGLTYILDESGRFRGIDGIDTAVEVALEKVPEEIRARLAQLVTPEMILNRERSEWQSRYDDWIDLEVVVGTSWTSNTSFELPNGTSIEYQVLTAIEAEVDCETGRSAGSRASTQGTARCLEITSVYSSDGEELTKMARENLEKIVDAVADSVGDDKELPKPTAAPGTDKGSISGRYRRIVDPATMMIYQETIERTIELAIEIGGNTAPSRSYERRESTFSYPSQTDTSPDSSTSDQAETDHHDASEGSPP